MSQMDPGQTQPMQSRAEAEIYTYGYSQEHRRFLGMRTAKGEAAFFLPYLRPGMRLLDCGCGVGSITVGLAEAVAAGEVVGVDREPGQIELARQRAQEQRVTNVRFEVGNVYALPFPDASFDAAFAHTVLEHLSDPLRALKEMRRVLKPGGIVGIKDPDYGTQLIEPSTPLIRDALALYRRVASVNGASPYYARHQRRLLQEAGFARSEGFAAVICLGSLEATRQAYELAFKPWLTEPTFVHTALDHKFVDQATLAAMLLACQRWSELPDAYYTLTHCAAVGWV
jgi:ubiquinone/menaquinone biosynthesis C-methylase UbiE